MAARGDASPELTDDQINARILSAARPLTDATIAVTDIGIDAMLQAGFHIDAFEKHLSILVSFGEREVIRDIVVQAYNHRIIANVFDITTTELVNLCSFLRSPKGQAVVREVQKLRRFHAQGKGIRTAEQIAWKKIFEAQQTSLTNKISAIRESSEKEIATLKAQIAALEKEMRQNMEKVRKTHSVAASFKWPPNHELCRKAWTLYFQDCVTRGVQPKRLTNDSLQEIAAQFAEPAKDDHLFSHILTNENKQKLKAWGERYIGEVEDKEVHQQFSYLLGRGYW